ncbi:MAG: nucleoside 2-deoxyribosyltransferase [Fidelibacterota bacterium]
MNIYFCGAISAGRELLPAYRVIVNTLKEYGTVLTEHVADPNLTAGGEKSQSNRDIFIRDLDWLKKADCLIAEVTTPSLGVGYEIAVGVRQNIPVHAFFQKKDARRLSALVSGNPGVSVHTYTELEELIPLVRSVMERNFPKNQP